MTETKVNTLLASWPSTMDTQGDADKMQQMVSLAREEAEIAAGLKERVEQFEFCVQRVAQALGVCCGGVDNSPVEQLADPHSTTRVLCDAIERLKTALTAAKKERDEAQATNQYYANALWIPGVRNYAVKDGNDAIEIKPQRVEQILARAESAEKRIGGLDQAIKPYASIAGLQDLVRALQSAIKQKDGALRPFADIGVWMFARKHVSDDTPVCEFSRINNAPMIALTRGQFKAAHTALQLSPDAAGEQADTARDAVIGASEWPHTVGGQAVKDNNVLLCESNGASDYCMHCGRDMCSPAFANGCSALERARRRQIAPTSIAVFGCRNEASGGARCELWCQGERCPYSRALKSTHPDQSPAKHGEA